jgi:HEAT repeat protein
LGYVFKQALASPDPLVRALALRGLGMLGREQDLPTFEAALKDPDASVGEASVRAMGSVGGTAGIEHLANVLLEADESQRKVAALTLAKCGDEGQRLLKDAVREDDMLVRRATTFGLAATRADWAREILLKLEKDDPQWFVRSAASEALASMQSVQEYALDCSPIALDKQGWLVEWGATRGMPVGLGRSAEPVLMRALAEGDTPVKLAAIQTLANIGGETAIEPLRAQLASSDPDVHAAAYQALKAISDKTGIKIARG